MTYAERIERVRAAIVDGLRTWHTYDEIARAADRAVLEAIREPTEEMIAAAKDLDPMYDSGPTSGEEYWDGMHAAIPRGDE